MKLVNMSIFEFDNFAKNHPLGSYHQSANYALFMSEQGYDYDIVGLEDKNHRIVAASIIFNKKIGLFYKYGYAPKGFLMDYYDPNMIKEFTDAIKKRYSKKNYAFIKISPEISIGEIDFKNKTIKYNKNKVIETYLKNENYEKVKNDSRFSLQIPKFNAVVLLKNFSLSKLPKQTRNKINKSEKMGITIEQGNFDSIPILYEFIKKMKKVKINHYYNYFNAFFKSKEIDIFMIKINYEKCLTALQKRYTEELNKNSSLVEKVMINPTNDNLRKKMASDNALETCKENIANITKIINNNQKEEFIGGAMTIKYKNRVNIIISGFNQTYKSFCPNYYLHYKMMEYYKEDFDFIDLNGITGDFSEENPYKGLNDFKLNFNPLTFENIGEYDLLINEGLYKNLDQNGLLAKEFKKEQKN